MMSDEAWLLMFVFATIQQVSVDGCNVLAVASSTDGALTPIGDIVELFTGAICSTYVEKPKIFFFLDANNGLSFDNARTFVHHQQDITSATNNHSGILICSSADTDFIKKLPNELERMVDKNKSLQRVIFDLMETGGKTSQLTRLWSTAPEDICILSRQECPVHPMVILEGETMTLAAVVEQIKICNQRLTVVEAASEDEKHAASSELYSQLVIEGLSKVVLYLDASNFLDETDLKKQRVDRCRKSASSGESTLVVVEDCELNARNSLLDFLKAILCNGCNALIVTLQTNSFHEIIAELKNMVPHLLLETAAEVREKIRQEEMIILAKKNPTTFNGCDCGSVDVKLREDKIFEIERLETGACIQEVNSATENLIFAKLLSNSIPDLCYFFLSDFMSIEMGVREKWLNRNPDITIVFITAEDEEVSETLNLGNCRWLVLKTSANEDSLLHIAAAEGQIEVVQVIAELVPSAVDCTTADSKNTPLMVATEIGQAEIVRYLIEKGADTTLLNRSGFSSLGIAAFTGNLECAQILSLASPINIANQDKATPVMLGAKKGHFELVQHLLEKGADIFSTDNQGNTCLHYAVLSRKLALVQLIAPLSSLNLTNDVGLTSLDVASLMREQEIVAYLQDQGALRNNQCDTLRELVQAGNPEVVAFVIHNSICEAGDNGVGREFPLFYVLSENGQ